MIAIEKQMSPDPSADQLMSLQLFWLVKHSGTSLSLLSDVGDMLSQ